MKYIVLYQYRDWECGHNIDTFSNYEEAKQLYDRMKKEMSDYKHLLSGKSPSVTLLQVLEEHEL